MLSELLRPGNGNGSGGGDNRFLVNLTPTEMDFSGVMDKTLGEIYEAWMEGKEIFISIDYGTLKVYQQATIVAQNTNNAYPSFTGYLIEDLTGVLVCWSTGYTDDADQNTYVTTLYQLSPLSM